MQVITQSTQTNFVIYLTDLTGLPKTGLTSAEVIAYYKKNNQSSFTFKTLNGSNFTEVGYGVYTITFTTTELNTLGDFVVVVNGYNILTFVGEASIVSASSAPTLNPPSIVLSNIFGQLVGVVGDPLANATVSWEILGLPSQLNNVGYSTQVETTLTDVNGYFAFNAPQQAQIKVIIPSISYTRVLTVPALSSVNLFYQIP